MRKLRAAGVVVAVLVGGAVSSTHVSAESAVSKESGTITDPLLLEQLDDARAQRLEGGSDASLTVEVHTADPAAAEAAVRAAGGIVTGHVQGTLVQARVAASKVAGLATAPGVTQLRAPRRAGYLTPPDRPTRLTAAPGFGSTVGEEVAITNADDWHNAAITGAGVKVGVVDFFNLDIWSTDQLGPVPDAAHQFCLDSIVPPDANPPTNGSYCKPDGTVFSDNGDSHGDAVVEIVKDMAPGSEIFIATVTTPADLQAAIDWFVGKGVTIITRSLGAPYDGPGDGTGTLDAVVDYAAAKGLTWFNSGGNDAVDAYMKRTVPTSLAGGGYVNFNDRRAGVPAGSDTWLRLDGFCVLFDGIRWSNDWYLPAAQRTDYSIEFWEPKTDPSDLGDHWNPTSSTQVKAISVTGGGGAGHNILDASQVFGANPLEAADLQVCPTNLFGDFSGITYVRVKRNSATPVGGSGDNLEIALGFGLLELDYYDVAGSAAKPVVDSKSASLVAVGAVDPAAGTTIGYYSSQGPTTDGRVKPDVSAPSGLTSWTFTNDGDPLTDPVFQGTSAASPVAAGMAALLQDADLAAPGPGTAALVKHFVTDLGAAGPDNKFGTGKVLLPAPPTPAPATTAAKYVPLALPTRVLDTRPLPSHVGPPSLIGPFAPGTIIDVDVLDGTTVPNVGVSAVAVNLTSTSTSNTGFLQAYPYMRARTGATSTLNISTAGQPRPNYAIVPVGQDGMISVYLHAGGQMILDIMGYFLDGQSDPVAEGRFVPLEQPERWTDTRGLNGAPLPAVYAGTPRKATAGETIEVPLLGTTALPETGVDALVVNVTAAGSTETGYLQAIPTGAVGAVHSTVNYTAGVSSANTAIVLLGTGGTISVFTSKSVNIIVDVVGYITDDAAPSDTFGLFVPITPVRAYDTRTPTPNAFTAGESRTLDLDGAPISAVPAGSAGVAANLTVVNPSAQGFLKAYPGPTEPSTSSLNFTTGKTVANGAMIGLSPTGQVVLTMSQGGHVIVDINGYFLAGVT